MITNISTKIKRNKSDILILVEHVPRELDIACLIKYYLSLKGYSATIASLPYLAQFRIKKKKIRVIAVPYCYYFTEFESIFSDYREITILNLSYEQIFQNINTELKAPKDQFVKQSIIHHSWSKQFFYYLTNYGVDENNIMINGNLSYSLYKKPYRDYFISRKELSELFQLNYYKKWILIPENYAAAFYTDSIIEDKIKNGIDSKEIIKYKNFATQSLKIILQWCSEFLQSKDIEIIFRPRPTLTLEKITDFISDNKLYLPNGFKIIKEKTVREWILASDIVISSYSTTLIEAAVAEKPIAMIAPIPFPSYLDAPWYQMVPQITNYEEFSSILSNPNLNSYRELKKWAEMEMMSNGDPIIGISNIISNLVINKRPIPDKYLKKNDTNRKKGLNYWILKNLVHAKNLIITPKQRAMEFYEDDFFSTDDVLQRVEHWNYVLTKNENSHDSLIKNK